MQFFNQIIIRGRRVRDRMWIRFTTAYAIIAYHHWTHILLRQAGCTLYSPFDFCKSSGKTSQKSIFQLNKFFF